MAAPLLNDYKVAFGRKRLYQTLLGGIRRLPREVILMVGVQQVFFFLLPWLISLPFTFIVKDFAILSLPVYIYGGIMLIISALFQFISQLLAKSDRGKVNDVNAKGYNRIFGDDDNDELYLDNSCTPGAWRFILSVSSRAYAWMYILPVFVSTLLMAIAVWYTSIPSIEVRVGSGPVAYVVYIFSWLPICMAQWILNSKAPTELSTYDTEDKYGFDEYSRAFHVIVAFVFAVLQYFLPDWSIFGSLASAANIVLLFMPIIWVTGILPSLRIMVDWALEQFIQFLCGGSPTANIARTANVLFYHIFYVILGWVFSAFVGLQAGIFSFGGLGVIIGSLLQVNARIPETASLSTAQIFIAIGFIAVPAYAFTKMASLISFFELVKLLIYIICPIAFVINWVQSKFIFRFIRNPFYFAPKDDTSLRVHHRILRTLHALTYLINPILAELYLACMLLIKTTLGTKAAAILSLWDYFLIGRAFRSVWQHPCETTLQIFFANIINDIKPTETTPLFDAWDSLGLLCQLLIMQLVVDRVRQIVRKLWFYIILFSSCMTDEKQQPQNWDFYSTLSVLAIPWSLAVIVFSSIISAPVLPIFGLPIMMITFPRPLRQSSSTAHENPARVEIESVFYSLLVPSLTRSLSVHPAIRHSSTGDMFLIRFERLLLFIHIVERGWDYAVTSMKGLELQGTSCHNVEASYIDEILDAKFLLTPGFNIMEPIDTIPIDCVTETKNSLTGIIDSPTTLKMIPSAFLKVVLWRIVKVLGVANIPGEWFFHPTNRVLLETMWKKFPSKWYDYLTSNLDQNPRNYGGMSRSEGIFDAETGVVPPMDIDESVKVLGIAMYCWIQGITAGNVDADTAPTPQQVLRIYRGELLDVAEKSWLQRHPELYRIIIDSYRIAVKLVYDFVVDGDLVEFVDLSDRLKEYEKKWKCGIHDAKLLAYLDPKYPKHRPNLFSIDKNKEGTFTSYTLQKKMNNADLIKLNSESVKAFWANLVLELLYVTNDDDERYSIQAHGPLLRNLSIQAMDPPLGYPIYQIQEVVNFSFSPVELFTGKVDTEEMLREKEKHETDGKAYWNFSFFK